MRYFLNTQLTALVFFLSLFHASASYGVCGPLPKGSYINSCTSCKYTQNNNKVCILSCKCLNPYSSNSRHPYKNTSINPLTCVGKQDLANIYGNLTCVGQKSI